MGQKLLIVAGVVFFTFILSGLAMACGCGGGQSSCHGKTQTGACRENQGSCQDPASVSRRGHLQQTAGAASGAPQEAVNVGNKICPVMGGEVDGKTTYEHEGKIYNFCCSGCIVEFKSDAQKYIQKVNEELNVGSP